MQHFFNKTLCMPTVHVAKYRATACNNLTDYLVINSDVLTCKRPGWYLHFRTMSVKDVSF